MKTYIAIALVGCFSLAAIAFAQKPESTKFVELLPVGTCVLLQLQDSGKFSIEIVDKSATKEDLNNRVNKYVDEMASKGGDVEREAAKVFKKIFSDISKDSTIYVVTNVNSDFLTFRPKGRESAMWSAVPFNAIGAIHDRDMANLWPK